MLKEAVQVRPRDDDGAPVGGCGGPQERRRHAGAPGSAAPHRADTAETLAAALRGAAPEEVPGRLCSVAVELLPVAGASVSLRSEGLPVLVGASDETAAGMAEMQATLGEGPCACAAETTEPVLAGDLTAGPDVARWPVYAHEATAAGVRAAYSLPLGDAVVCVGTLDLYGTGPGELAGPDLHTARLLASALTVALMSLPRGEEEVGRSGGFWLGGLTAEHDEIHQAIGMIMAQLGVGADEALARLRGHAFACGRTALEAAHDVVGHRRRFDDDSL
ncbi:GAF and ANTAR domain-containing protein [Streptomyces sp. NPDC051636]|uniref:GAF and ANTAR domain-containing protein n=1 Tax=Streptomyces sp. NPDC051636 TaxID=3365663 RepID=UPI0037A09CF9